MKNGLMSDDLLTPITSDTIDTLSNSERQKLDDFYQSIRLKDSGAVAGYGSSLQQSLSRLSGRMISLINTDETGHLESVLSSAVAYLSVISETESLPSGTDTSLQTRIRDRYRAAEKNVDMVTTALQQYHVGLIKDQSLLTQLYHMNAVYYRELSLAIWAGRQKISDYQNGTMSDLRQRALHSPLSENAETASDMQTLLTRFCKKLEELELTCNVALQTAAVIRSASENRSRMALKVQETLFQSIPLWKEQVMEDITSPHAISGPPSGPAHHTRQQMNLYLLKNLKEMHLLCRAGK
ncbi:MAG: toxic anion resistance protein [Lachnospiraceae bacterium]|nr:toxic anion resistance protein [Lachnospiraceae bacterium]